MALIGYGLQSSKGLQREVVRNEMLRSALMSIILVLSAVPAILLFSGTSLVGKSLDAELATKLERLSLPVFSVLLGVALAELVIWFQLRRAIEQERGMVRWMPWIQTVVEVLMPSVLLWISLGILGVENTFGGALSWLYFLVIALTALHLNFGLCVFAGILSAVGFIFVGKVGLWVVGGNGTESVLTAGYSYYVKAFVLVATGGITGLVALGLRRQMEAAAAHAAECDRAISIFGQHVFPEVANRLLHQRIEEGGESKRVSVMFFDIRDFSIYAASHSAKEVMAYLNTLFGRLIDVVNAHGGIVNKFLGDGFMAVFGTPVEDKESAMRATKCALALIEATEELVSLGRIPETRVGVGLHIGESMTGNVGGSGRKEYTVIGDSVNIAARVEQVTKVHEARVLVTEDVWRELPAGEIEGEDLGMVELKGQPAPIRLYRLL